MNKPIAALILILAAGAATAQVPGPGRPCSLTVSGITFGRSVNDADQNAKVENNRIVLTSATGANYFNAPDESRFNASAPILLAEVDNSKPFTFTAKLTTQLRETYDAGALFVFVDNNLWHKFAFEMDEHMRKRVVTVRTTNTSDDNNHDILTGDSVYLKISSNGKQIGFYYSTDNEHWNLARIYKNTYPEVIWLGLSSQSPRGTGNQSVFEEISLEPASILNFRAGK